MWNRSSVLYTNSEEMRYYGSQDPDMSRLLLNPIYTIDAIRLNQRAESAIVWSRATVREMLYL